MSSHFVLFHNKCYRNTAVNSPEFSKHSCSLIFSTTYLPQRGMCIWLRWSYRKFTDDFGVKRTQQRKNRNHSPRLKNEKALVFNNFIRSCTKRIKWIYNGKVEPVHQHVPSTKLLDGSEWKVVLGRPKLKFAMSMWQLTFLQQWLWRTLSSGM
jgi:hypothetical protein